MKHAVTRDGTVKSVHATEAEAFGALLRHQGQSTDWAIKYEGWAIVPAPLDVSDVFIGRTRDSRVYVDVKVAPPSDRDQETVTHDQARVARLSISGVEIRKGGQLAHDGDWQSCGQILDTLRAVTEPADGWTLADVRKLADIWEHWHLNDMRDGCAHQTVVWEDEPYHRPSLELTKPCPVSGYRYGHAWLSEELPADVTDWLVTRFDA